MHSLVLHLHSHGPFSFSGDGTEEEEDMCVEDSDGGPSLRGVGDIQSDYSLGGSMMPRFERSHLIVWQVTQTD